MSKQDIEKRLGFAAQGVKVEMAAPANWESKLDAKNLADSFNVEGLRELLGSAKEIARKYPQYKALGQKMADGINMVLSAVKQMKAESMKSSRPGVKAKMALTISTVGAKNLCYEALANLKALAQLASETNSGWDFHVTVMTDHVKNAMSQLESSPAQAGRYLERAIDTLGMLKKIEPKRLNDIQKGSFKQLIGYVAKSLRDARANIKVVTTASRPGVKAKMETPMRVALTPMHTRAEQGYENFIAVLMKFGGITREQAQKAFKAFKDAKVLVTKEQYMGGGITVKHGAFMERDVIRRAAGLPEESPRPGTKAKA